MADSNRTWTSGKFALTVDGHKFGFLQNMSGPTMKAEVANQPMGPRNFSAKNVTTIKWGDVTLRSGMGMSKGMYMWIRDAFLMNLQYKTASVEVADFDYNLQRRVDLDGVLITGVTFPGLKGDGKENFYVDITCAVEKARWMSNSGKLQGDVGAKHKAWTVNNFRWNIWGLPCTKTSEISGIKWTVKTCLDCVGERRENDLIATSSNVDNFKIKMSARDFAGWEPKLKSWFIDGQVEATDEGTLILELLGHDTNKVLGTVTCMGVGLVSADFAGGKFEAQSDKPHHFEVEFYAEQVAFEPTYNDA